MVRHPPTDASTQDHKLLGIALRELRTRARLTQEELAARADIGVSYLSQLENGHRGVGWHTVTRLREGIGADRRQLDDAIAAAEKQHSSKR
ncbi:MAG TPA: helix-turn-helix transcriptional regulator [Solirubrobacteraceae bacterium]|jgi:transcriptional regulator with XRE-family HTH domain|nr:helix-turn-helix transcriptional regulator [Solirubrobacteraceae bacterium]